MSIDLRLIPSTGETIPAVGLGTWRAFDRPPGQEAALAPVLQGLVERGGRVVDTSPMYGRAESVLGGLGERLGLAPSLFLATKVWTSGRREGEAQMEASARKLRVGRIDLIQVHNLLDVSTHLETLGAWKAEGRVRLVGVTHYLESALPALESLVERRTLDFVQINYSLAERGAERSLFAKARDRGVAVLVNRPFGSGELFLRTRGRPLPPFAADISCRTWSQFFLKFVLGEPAVTCVIPATGSPLHLAENLLAGEPPFPDPKLRGRMAAAFEGL